MTNTTSLVNDPRFGAMVGAVLLSPVVETIKANIPQGASGTLATRLLLKIGTVILDIDINIKSNTNNGQATYEATVNGIADVIVATTVETMLTSAITAGCALFLTSSVGLTIGIGVFSSIAVATTFDRAVRPMLQAIGEFETHLVDQVFDFSIFPTQPNLRPLPPLH